MAYRIGTIVAAAVWLCVVRSQQQVDEQINGLHVQYCLPPPAPRNGQVDCTQVFLKTFQSQILCTFTCNAGYKFQGLADSSYSTLCVNGSYGYSSRPDPPPCVSVCEDPALPPLVTFSCTNTSGDERTCKARCQAFHMFETSPPKSFRCVSGGGWSPQLSTIPKCVSRSGSVLVPGEAVCSVWGQDHYHTFDDRVYSFRGQCKYVLAYVVNTFTIMVINDETCNGRSDCKREVEIYFGDNVIALKSTSNGPVVLWNNKDFPVPGSRSGTVIEKIGSYINVRSSLRFTVKWDGSQTVTVKVTDELHGQISGLCGTYNGNPNDDFENDKGVVVSSVASFGNSWKKSDLSDGSICADSAQDSQCDISSSGQLQQLAQSQNQLSDSSCEKLIVDFAFRPCHSAVSPEPYVGACKEDCCKQTIGDCTCESLEAYSRACLEKNIELRWRNSGRCEKQCPPDMVHKECGSSCIPDCSNVDATCSDPTCIDGCFCPDGWVMHNGKCIESQQCPCPHGGKEYKQGSVVTEECNTCTCSAGKWNCTHKDCDAVCSVIGDSHYMTFDGRKYNFMGFCSYFLVRGTNFNIVVDNERCGNGVACTKTLTLSATGLNVKLDQNNLVTINGDELKHLPYQSPKVRISQISSLFIQATLNNGISVIWDGDTRIYVKAPPSLKYQLNGLCGTYDGRQGNDFLTPQGSRETNTNIFGNQWKTSKECLDTPVTLQANPCEAQSQRKAQASRLCRQLRSSTFAACRDVEDVKRYYDDCMYDLCSCNKNLHDCFCPSLGAYADVCAVKGVEINWRTRVKECALQCPPGQEYQVCVRPCEHTCHDLALNSGKACDLKCVEGCSCPDGQSLNEQGECVPAEKCPCVFDGREYPAGYTTLQGTDICVCTGAKWQCSKISYSNGNITKVQPLCPESMEYNPCAPSCPLTCEILTGANTCDGSSSCEPGCVCKDNYVFDGDKCIEPTMCPCYHAGRAYFEGDTFFRDCNKCVCKNQNWQCDNEECPSTCKAYGDSHYTTFDGRSFEFQGSCDYVMTQSRANNPQKFLITTSNMQCGSTGVTCAKGIDFIVGEPGTASYFHLQFIKGKRVIADPDSPFLVREVGENIYVTTPFGVSIQWDMGTRMYIRLATRHIGKVDGLCGNYNGNEKDDFLLRSGGLPVARAITFADSWRVHSFCEAARDVGDTCAQAPQRKPWAQQKCAVLSSEVFKPCHAFVDPKEYIERCIFDACGCDMGDDCNCLCTALAAYAQECANQGVPIMWRTKDLCGLACNGCYEYNPCISLCATRTCDNRLVYSKDGDDCENEQGLCFEGCDLHECPEGQVYDSLVEPITCIPEPLCDSPACEINGKSYREGERVEDPLVCRAECEICNCRNGELEHITFGRCVPLVIPPLTSTPKPPVVTAIRDLNVTVPTGLPRVYCLPGWTSWMSATVPTHTNVGDRESIALLRMKYSFCYEYQITDIHCRTISQQQPGIYFGQNVTCNLKSGLTCYHQNQARGLCLDYEVRFFCDCTEPPPTDWTPPLTPEGPTRTTAEPAITGTPSVPHIGPKSTPSVPDTPVIPTKLCGWTPWMNSFAPNIVGDIESIANLRLAYSFCEYPVEVTCRTAPDLKNPHGMRYDQARQMGVTCDLNRGLVCLNSAQVKGQPCYDYEVAVKCEDDCPPGVNYTTVSTPVVGIRNVTSPTTKPTLEPDLTTLSSTVTTTEDWVFTTPGVDQTIPTLASTVTPPVTYPPVVKNRQACDKELGLSSRDVIGDDQFEATSSPRAAFDAHNGRLNNFVFGRRNGGAWMPRRSDPNPCLIVDLKYPHKVTGIKSQGRPNARQWVTEYQVYISTAGSRFVPIRDSIMDEPQTFHANSDNSRHAKVFFKDEILLTKIAICPTNYVGAIALRVDLMTCDGVYTTPPPDKPGYTWSYDYECTSTWGEWIDRSEPTPEKGEREVLTEDEKEEVCPGGTLVDVRCKESEAEPTPGDHPQGTCTLENGYECINPDPIPGRDRPLCLDYRIQYLCDCNARPTTPAPTIPPPKEVITCGWSSWLNGDKPKTSSLDPGDLETIALLQTRYGLCSNIADIHCRVADSSTSAEDAGQEGVECDAEEGLRCYNRDVTDGTCYDYEVSVLCWDDTICKGSPPVPTEEPTGIPTYEITSPGAAGTVTVVCPPGKEWLACAFKCDEVCHYMGQISGACSDESSQACLPGCKPVSPFNPTECSDSQLLLDYNTCVEKAACTCLKPDGTAALPFETWQDPESPCSVCSCFNNDVTCVLSIECTSVEVGIPTGTIPFIEPVCGWSDWINEDIADTGIGDIENLSALRSRYGLCAAPTAVECRDAKTGEDINLSGQVVTCDTTDGLKCWNSINDGKCKDYEIRVYCPCAPPVTTAPPPGVSISPGQTTPSVPPVVTSIFLEQSTPPVTVQMCGWTEWMNGHTKDSYGDLETLSNLRKDYIFCDDSSILSIKCQDSVTNKTAKELGQQEVICDLEFGLVCINVDQPDGQCADYEVSFFCDPPGVDCSQVDITTTPTRPDNYTTVTYPPGVSTTSREKTTSTTVTPETTTTEPPPLKICVDPMTDAGPVPVADTDLKASSSLSKYTGPERSRLDSRQEALFTGAWIPEYNSRNQWIEVKFREPLLITGITTQGRQGFPEWISTYKAFYTVDGSSFISLKQLDGWSTLFEGNSDSDSKNTVNVKPTRATAVLIRPQTWENRIALRFQLHGCLAPETPTPPINDTSGTTTVPPSGVTLPPTVATKIPDVCRKEMGLHDMRIRDDMISASSFRDAPHAPVNGRVGGTRSWMPAASDPNPYFQIDFVKPQLLSGITTQGRPDVPLYVKTYKVYHSTDGVTWTPYRERLNLDKIFYANWDSDTPVTHYFKRPIRTQFIQIRPTTWNDAIAMRIEIHGCSKDFYPLYPTTTPVPFESTKISTPGPISTTPRTDITTNCVEWDQWLDLNQPSLDNKNDIEPIADLIANSLHCDRPMAIECQTVTASQTFKKSRPQKVSCNLYEGLKCLASEVQEPLCYNYKARIGCLKETPECLQKPPEKPPLPVCHPDVDIQHCPEACQPGFFCDGLKCVTRSSCPCNVDGKIIRPGGVDKNENCDVCQCLNGEALCMPALPCPDCEKGVSFRNMSSCDCQCLTCEQDQFQCTDGTCIGSHQRCDDIVDCVDDEFDCVVTKKFTPPPPTTVPPTENITEVEFTTLSSEGTTGVTTGKTPEVTRKITPSSPRMTTHKPVTATTQPTKPPFIPSDRCPGVTCPPLTYPKIEEGMTAKLQRTDDGCCQKYAICDLDACPVHSEDCLAPMISKAVPTNECCPTYQCSCPDTCPEPVLPVCGSNLNLNSLQEKEDDEEEDDETREEDGEERNKPKTFNKTLRKRLRRYAPDVLQDQSNKLSVLRRQKRQENQDNDENIPRWKRNKPWLLRRQQRQKSQNNDKNTPKWKRNKPWLVRKQQRQKNQNNDENIPKWKRNKPWLLRRQQRQKSRNNNDNTPEKRRQKRQDDQSKEKIPRWKRTKPWLLRKQQKKKKGNQKKKDNIPKWKKRWLARKKAKTDKNNQEEKEENIPRWKKRRLAQKKGRNDDDKQGEKEENIPRWKKRLLARKKGKGDEEDQKEKEERKEKDKNISIGKKGKPWSAQKKGKDGKQSQEEKEESQEEKEENIPNGKRDKVLASRKTSKDNDKIQKGDADVSKQSRIDISSQGGKEKKKPSKTNTEEDGSGASAKWQWSNRNAAVKYEIVEIQQACNCTVYACRIIPVKPPQACFFTQTTEVKNGIARDLPEPKQVVYQLGEKWSDGLCRTCTCTNDTDGDSHIICTEQECSPCKLGEKKVSKRGSCCGECEPEGCVVGGQVFQAGQELPTGRKCYTAKCEKNIFDRGFIVQETQIECEKLDNLPYCNETETYDLTGCCRTCVPPKWVPVHDAVVCESCTPRLVEGEPTKTIGYFTKILSSGVKCFNDQPIPNLKQCDGYCSSTAVYTDVMKGFENRCKCCQPNDIKTLPIQLLCTDGKRITEYRDMPESCACKPCVNTN